MGSETCKALNFDFITHYITDNMSEMEINGSYTKAYYDIRKYLKNNGFEHTQESAYTSIKPISYAKVQTLVEELVNNIPYLKDAIKSFQVSSIERTYDVTEMLHKEHSIEVVKPTNLYKLQTTYGLQIDDTKVGQKSIRFDLSGELLKQNFEKENIDLDITNAYKWVEKYFKELGYSHEQGSVYLTPIGIKDSEVIKHLIKFSEELPYVAESFSSVQITNIESTYDITDLANGRLKNDKIKSNDNLEIQSSKQMKMEVNKDNSLSIV